MPKPRSYSREDIIKCGHGDIFGRDTAKLPLPNMLMFDRITDVNEDGGRYGKGEVIAELDVDPDMWFFKCHFIGDPVMPGCLGLDAMWQLCGFFLAWQGFKGRGRALGVGNVKFTGQVLPTAKTVTYRVEIKRIFSIKLAIAIGDGTVSVDGHPIYSANALRVGLFSATDDL